VKTIELDATSWKDGADFSKSLLPALGAPSWHGNSVDALIDSIVYGDINAVDPPFTIRITGWRHAPSDAVQQVKWAMETINPNTGVTWELIP
jgi:hypothetical protein